MKKLQSHILGIDSGDLMLFEHFSSEGPMWNASGPREVVREVLFAEPFTDLPSVTVGLSLWDVAGGSNLRMDLGTQNISTRGFEIRLRTWDDSRIARARVAWQAIGPVRDDELWEIA